MVVINWLLDRKIEAKDHYSNTVRFYKSLYFCIWYSIVLKIEFVGQRPFLLGQKIIIGTSYRYNINKYKTSNEINGLRGSNS